MLYLLECFFIDGLSASNLLTFTIENLDEESIHVVRIIRITFHRSYLLDLRLRTEDHLINPVKVQIRTIDAYLAALPVEEGQDIAAVHTVAD